MPKKGVYCAPVWISLHLPIGERNAPFVCLRRAMIQLAEPVRGG